MYTIGTYFTNFRLPPCVKIILIYCIFVKPLGEGNKVTRSRRDFLRSIPSTPHHRAHIHFIILFSCVYDWQGRYLVFGKSTYSRIELFFHGVSLLLLVGNYLDDFYTRIRNEISDCSGKMKFIPLAKLETN